MSDNVANEMQCAPFDPNEVVDWAAEYESIMQETWLECSDPMVDAFDWDGEGLPGQGTAAVLPGDSSDGVQRILPHDLVMQDTWAVQEETSLNNGKTPILCNVEGCHAGPFGRKAEFQRHERQKHTKPRFSCTAVGCNRIGERGFAREDKLKDHILAGHDHNTTFHCPFSGCAKILTRDIMAFHRRWYDHSWKSVNDARTCPMPRCSFQINLRGRKKQQMDDLVVHLHNKHDTDSRMRCNSTLRERGYDAASGYVVCPLCPPQAAQFEKHTDFSMHAVEHLGVSASSSSFIENQGFSGQYCYFDSDVWVKKTEIPPEFIEHRRTLLSLWPETRFLPIWDDVINCGTRGF